jgi:hypothetical protein
MSSIPEGPDPVTSHAQGDLRLLPEYAAAHRKVIGGGASEAFLAAVDQPGLTIVRIGLRPTWVGVLDFANRLPHRTPAPVRAALTV